MGADIHIWTEKFWDGVWHHIDKIQDDSPGYRSFKEPYSGRNYWLFSILADVRNSGDPKYNFIPIEPPRGYPADMSESVDALMQSGAGDYHSHSYFTLKELLDFDWLQGTTKVATDVDAFSYVQWINDKQQPWNDSDFVKPPRDNDWHKLSQYRNVSQEEMEQLLRQFLLSGHSYTRHNDATIKQIHAKTKVEYKITYADAAGEEWWYKTIPFLLGQADSEYDSVRLVFAFDN
jgi:hypothetical protein